MHTAMTGTAATTVPISSREKLRRFVSAYWLRPENAFWMVLRSDALDAVPMRRPCLDLSCGDGVFSFLHAGGRFAQEFDVFCAVANLDRVGTDHADIFDYVDEAYRPKIIATPAYKLDCGTDYKESLLAKASRLDLYEQLVPHDSNEPLPFDSGRFETVYCNAAYWVQRIDAFLSEVRRITVPGGTVVLQVKLDTIKSCTLEHHRQLLGDRWLGTINRGRFDSWPTLCDRRTWERRFSKAGLEIVSVLPFVTRTHGHIWDIGLRPIAPLLIKTMNAVHAHLRCEIKRDWVDLFCNLLEPFCRPDMDLFTDPGRPIEIQYVLTPRT